MKKSLYAIIWISLLGVNNALAAITPDNNKVNTWIVTDWTADQVVQQWIVNLMGYLMLAAVLFGLWWGFNILTAWGDEDKVSKWKTVIMNALIWLVVIFLVGTVVRWVLSIIWG